jgi:flagellar basal-body rod protein FlgF
MDRLVFTSHAAIAEGAIARQSMVNEMANVSTVGFKRSFDVAMRSLKVEGAGFDSRYQVEAVSRDVIDLAPGAMMNTGRPLDIAMQNATVMGVQAPNGQLAFTRRGDLRLNAQGALENGLGHLVRGQGGPLVVPPGFRVSVNPDGSVYANDPAAPNAPAVQVGQILLRDASRTPLIRREDGLYGPLGQPPGSDFANGPQKTGVKPEALEGSNVNAIDAMARMIDHSRSFEAQIRAIKEARSLDESGATLMKNA